MPKVFEGANGPLGDAQPKVVEGANGFLRDAQPKVFEGANGFLRDAQPKVLKVPTVFSAMPKVMYEGMEVYTVFPEMLNVL